MKTNSPLWCLTAWQSVGSGPISFWLQSPWSGSGVFRRAKGFTILERYYKPFNPQTPEQQAGRSTFQYAVASWQSMGESDRASWNYYQDYRRQKPVMSGYNLFISKYLLSNGNPEIPPSGRRDDY